MGQTIGVVKCYMTRVRKGHMLSEMDDPSVYDKILQDGHEFGTTSHKPRRVGWLDIPVVNYNNSSTSQMIHQHK